ncbi:MULTISPECIES: DUF4352 domain-containing protein [Bacillaceae]|uniref:DUF4352 domain-containing protein n=1 Tax=Evansella alkalicola TaxID=745819 RepID=A0ABS6K091_9BACI|nr:MULTISPECIES: DUF4352 domain-containing protein [Bacillaceae]MBU9724254.1 DUF4352 domain-containing protein [Bacillus alkalicola]
MMKYIYKILLIMVAVLILAACGGDSDEGNNNATTDDATNSDSEEVEDTGNGEVVDGDLILQLGETGTFESVVGKYEITVHSAESHESIEGRTPSNDVITILDITFENVGETTLDADGIARANLNASRNSRSQDFIENFTGNIEPGESMSGELYFDHLFFTDNEYELIFGHSFTSTPDRLIFQFTTDDLN